MNILDDGRLLVGDAVAHDRVYDTEPLLVHDDQRSIPGLGDELVGVSESGAMGRDLTQLKRGDVIVPLYKAFSADESLTASSHEGEPYSVGSNGLTVDYGYLPDGKYLYCFCIQDAFGDSLSTGGAQFGIDPDGTVYFE